MVIDDEAIFSINFLTKPKNSSETESLCSQSSVLTRGGRIFDLEIFEFEVRTHLVLTFISQGLPIF